VIVSSSVATFAAVSDLTAANSACSAASIVDSVSADGVFDGESGDDTLHLYTTVIVRSKRAAQ
jgi:hypothetical protein